LPVVCFWTLRRFSDGKAGIVGDLGSAVDNGFWYNHRMKMNILFAGAAYGVLMLCGGPAAAGGGFPLCMYGVNSARDLAVIKEAGFNCFHTYNQDPETLAGLAAEAGKLKMKMTAYPDKVMDSAYGEAAKKWPMLAWYLYDEPEVRGIPPAELEKLERKTKAWSPKQRTAFVMGDGNAALTYGAYGDALMTDWYPVPHLKTESVGYHVALVKSAAGIMDAERPDRPVWAVLQAFDWMIYPQRRKERVGRYPTFTELRFMTYLALARGANGLFYYTFSQEGKTLDAWPERWFLFKRLAAEINSLAPVLEKGADTEPPTGLDERLIARVLKKGFKRYMILLNPSDAKVPLDAALLKGWRPLFEEKRRYEDILPGKENLYMPGYRTLVLEK